MKYITRKQLTVILNKYGYNCDICSFDGKSSAKCVKCSTHDNFFKVKKSFVKELNKQVEENIQKEREKNRYSLCKITNDLDRPIGIAQESVRAGELPTVEMFKDHGE